MKHLVVLILISLMIFSCTKDNDATSNLIYSNSFENQDLIRNWSNAGLSADVFKDGGDSCLSVSGGCLTRFAQFTYGPVKNSIKFRIRFWAKPINTGNYGTFDITTDTLSSDKYSFVIDYPQWKQYETDSVLFCPAKGIIRLILVPSGGIVGGGILVDNLEIFSMN